MKEIRRILKEETAIPENIDKAMEDVLSGILNSPDEKTTGALSKKTNGERTKNSGNKKKIIRILLLSKNITSRSFWTEEVSANHKTGDKNGTFIPALSPVYF